MTRFSALYFASAAALLLLVGGCRREQIRVYIAPKETAPSAPAERSSQGPRIAWKLPEGWREVKPSSKVSFASFSVAAQEGEAFVDLSQMPDLRGRETVIVNMWRKQVGVEPLSEEEAVKALSPLAADGAEAQSFEIEGTRDGKAIGIVTAMLHRPEGTWFFKLAGDGPAVSAHKAEFFDFVKTVRFVESDPSAPAAEPQPEPGSAQFRWSVPEGWTALAAGAMQAAKFSVPEQSGAKAEVAVSIFPSESGGTLANVNRWRKQLGLGEVDEAGLKDLVTPLDATPGALLADLTNDQRRMLGAIVPRENGWWFYKLMGDAPAVLAARESFIEFVKSAP